MNPNEKNVVDKFLDKYEEISDKAPTVERVYIRPSKAKCLLYFAVCVGILFVMLFVMGFSFTIGYILFLLGDIAIGAFFGYNLFSNVGIGIPTYVKHYYDEEQYPNSVENIPKNEYNDEESEDRKDY